MNRTPHRSGLRAGEMSAEVRLVGEGALTVLTVEWTRRCSSDFRRVGGGGFIVIIP